MIDRNIRSGGMGTGFISAEFLPEGADEYYLRNEQVGRPVDHWRPLRAEELEGLVRNGNTAEDWDKILVTDEFDPGHVKNCEFFGLVRIGRVRDGGLEHHDMRVPTGLTNSRIISCDFGDDVAVHNVRYLSHYILGDAVMLLNVDEMHVTDHAKFGNGIVKQGEDEKVRIWIDLVNEVGGRAVLPFDGMTCGDAWLWSKYRDDAELMQRLGEITQKQFDPRRGFYGTVGQSCVVKNCRIIKDVQIGDHAYVKGANKLKNLTIRSSAEEPTQIGEGVELVNGIIGLGCKVFYGCKAVRFVMGTGSNLKYGGRLIHSYLGDNSTVSCCEILNNLIFPAHEQHHNDSFLTAAAVLGQSNVAAGATVGSNHNSRANDGEILAGRGFWAGLCVSLKHYCRFASFVLLAKGDYPAELNVPLPFSLLSNDEARDRLQIMPAYWWRYNMYALARNSWKFRARDHRVTATQKIEFDYLAPDTVEEIFSAIDLLELWAGRAELRRRGRCEDGADAESLAALGREVLEDPARCEGLEVLGEGVENSRRPTVVLKPAEGRAAYRDMLHYYAARTLMEYMRARPKGDFAGLCEDLDGPHVRRWVNLGGQLVTAGQLDELKRSIKTGRIDSWTAVHEACERYWQGYPRDRQKHALATLKKLLGSGTIDRAAWHAALDRAVEIQNFICEQTYRTRKKDYDNPFRQSTFDNPEEMRAVVGTAEDNPFVHQVREESEEFARRVEAVKTQG